MEPQHNSALDYVGNAGPTYAFPLTFAQRRLWFLDQLAPGETSYLIPWSVRVHGSLDAKALAYSLNQIVERHEVFRTTFIEVEGEPAQLVSPPTRVPVPVVDLSHLTLSAAEKEANRLARIEAETPIDLSTGPILRAKLLLLAPDDHVLLLTTHHIAFDGWSRSILVRELNVFYEAFLSGTPAQIPELPIQYADFAVWQEEHLRDENLDRQLDFWKHQLRDLPLSIEIPTDRPRPAVQTYNGVSFHFSLTPALSQRIKEVSRQQGVTPYMTMLAAFQVLISRYTGQEDIPVGTPTANRNRPELEGIIGLFANTLVFRTQLSGDPTFHELLARVKETALSAYANEEMPFEQLVQELRPERSLSHSPLFQILFSLRNTPSGSFRLANLELEFFLGSGETSKYDLSMYLEEHPGGIHGKIEYNTDLYDATTVKRIQRHYQTLLESALEAPDTQLSKLQMLEPAERTQLLVEWNDTARDYPRTRCLHQVFEDQAKQHPEAVAVTFGEESITYDVLNQRANQLAHHLQQQGIAAGQRVGLLVERSIEMFVGLLGIQKSGAAYVPLDPAYPTDRVRATLEAAGISLLVLQQPLLPSLPSYSGNIICLDQDRALIERQSTENPSAAVTPDDAVYVIFTSGSTGRPKGVELGHRGVVNLLDWMREELNFGPGDVFPALASFAFDMSIPELYLALISGGTVALARRHLAADGEELSRFLLEQRATLVHATPTTWSLLLDAGYTGSDVTRCIGAEPLPTELFTRLMDAAPGKPLYNFYGPTETTVWSTYQRLISRSERVVIGRPLANTEIYIVDRHGNPTPIGVPGEILIGGDGVAHGYLDEPELTADKFIPDTFSRRPNARLYRTGDLGRYLPDGRIEFAGRIDHQVKIRGYRIELGEIETTLAQHPSVRECVVLAREDSAGDKRLVAYIVTEPGANVATSEMREWVMRKLPEYMVPAAVVVLDRMPLSPNGKVDRKALPAPERGAAPVVGTMSNPVEEMIANIWAEILNTGEVTQSSNFFDLGGHSLLATKVVARIRQAIQVNLPLSAIFESPTVAGLADRVKALVHEDKNPFETPLLPANWDHAAPLSFAQQRLWFLDQLEPNSSFYNVPMAIRLIGSFDAVAMERSLNEIVARHESLRTTFQLQGEEPVQIVARTMPLPLTKVNLSHLAPDEREEEARRLVSNSARSPFNLSTGPLFRALIVEVTPEDHILLLNLHHAISDGWSLGILTNELAALYEAFRAGSQSPLTPLSLTYSDYAIWQRNYLEAGALERQLSYWKKHMAGAPLSIELPTDRARPPVQTFNGSEQTAFLSPEVLDNLKALSRAEGATLFITLLAAFNVLLSRYSGQKDIVLGTASAGRHQPETEKLIGYFANTLVLRSDLSADPTFRELLRQVRETTLNAYANQDVPFEKLVEELNPPRDMSRSPLFQVMIIQQNAFQRSNVFGNLKAVPYSASGAAAKVDLLLNVSEDAGRLRCALKYNTDLYDAPTINRMLENYGVLLELVAQEPTQKVSQITLERAEERQQYLVEWNDTAAEYPTEKRVSQLVEEQAASTPDATAVIFGDQSLTYRDLNAQANQLANYLRARGIQHGDRVGIYLERSLSMMVSLLGVQKCGAVYVPLDPAYPAERLKLVVEDAKIATLITQQQLLGSMPEYPGAVVCLDCDAAALASQSDINPTCPGSSDDPIYIIFTSGSMGRPKGVEVSHRGVVNLLTWMAKELVVGPGDIIPALASFAFDMSVPELYLALVTGGTVLIAQRHLVANGEELAEFLTRHRATVVHATPTTWRLLLDAGFTGANLKRCIGAEPLPRELFVRLMKAAQGTPLFNLYGPTETTVWSTFHTFTSADEPIVVGRPIANTQVYLLDQNLQPVPVGVRGGIYIAGDGVTRGYFGRPELTAEKFLPNPFAQDGRIYSTGDIGRYLPDGRIEYIERADNQIKIRGFRIELGEIEAILASHSSVSECVVIAREDQPGNKSLTAYFVCRDAQTKVDAGELRAFLKERLPEYMVPRGWMQLDRLPLSANGKIDRKNLPMPDAVATRSAGGLKPSTPVAVGLAQIWEKTLNVSNIGLDDDFFNLGGHSLLAVQMMSRAREAFGCELPLTLLFGSPRLGDLAKVIQSERQHQPFKTLIPIRKTGHKPPLFCISRPNVNALGFVFLARHLSPDQPVIGLQSQVEKDGNTWVYDQAEYEAKAKEYIKAMRELYPEGPYLLTGYCEGAHIAFEMARELEAMNLPVGMISILDAWPIENTVSRTKFILRGYLREMRKFRRMDLRDKFHYLTRYRFAGAKRNASAPATPAAIALAQQKKLIAEQIEKRYWPGAGFVPTKYSGRLTLFRVKKQLNVRINDYKMGWSERALGGVDVITVPGTHAHLLREPFVIELAEKMQACMDRAIEAHADAARKMSEAEGTLDDPINVS
jgi:amino acid adenylation domain-containing protein